MIQDAPFGAFKKEVLGDDYFGGEVPSQTCFHSINGWIKADYKLELPNKLFNNWFYCLNQPHHDGNSA